jgi:hypothetical protein
VGVPRSGTTLVQSLLAAHSALTSFTESHLFDRHFSRLPLLGTIALTRDPAPRLRVFLAENDADSSVASSLWGRGSPPRRLLLPLHTRTAARRLLGVFDELARGRGKEGWIEKTPRHLRYIPFLEAVSRPGPAPVFVHVVRQGLEVVASLRQASQTWERAYGLDACVRRWNHDVGYSLSRVGAAHDRFVFYEELTSQPETTLRRLFDDLDLGWEPEILERYAGASRGLVTGDEAWKADVGRAIRPSGTSEHALSASEKARVRDALQSHLYDQLRERAGRRPLLHSPSS